MATDPQPNIMGMPNPVAQPDATNAAKPTASAPQDTASANPAITQTDDQVQAKLKDMQAQVNAQAPGGFIPPAPPKPAVSASPTAQQEVIDTSKTQPGVLTTGIKTNEPNVANQQGTQPQQQQFQAMTGNTNGGQASDLAWAASARTGKAQNQLSPQDLADQKAISDRSMASQAGQVKNPMDGVVYDPASNTYKDPRTLNYFQGLSQTGTPLFSAVQETAIKGAFGNLESGIVTTDGYRQANEMIGNALTSAKTQPLTIPSPTQLADPTGLGSSSNDTLKFLNQQMSSSLLGQQQSDQSAAVQALYDQATQVESMLKNPDIDPQFQAILEQQKLLLQSKQNAEADIGNNFDNMVVQQTRSNDLALKKSMASINASGQVGSMIADSYLNSVIKSNEKSIRDIGVQRQKAVRDAELAYSQQDLQLTFQKLQRTQTLQDNYNQLQFQGAQLKDQYANNMFDRQMKIQQFDMQLSQFQDQKQDRAETKYTDSVAKWAMTGAVPDENQKLYFKQQDAKFGYPAGYTESIIGAQKKMMDAKTKTDNLDAIKNLYDVLDKIPAGQKVSLNGSTYFGTQGTGKVEVDETTGIGRMSYVDPTDGSIKIKTLGQLGSPKAGNYEPVFVNGTQMSYNKTTGQYTPIVPSGGASGDAGWDQTACPDGVTGGQCGEFIHNFVSDYPFGVNTVKDRAAIVNVPKTAPPQVGDVLLQNYGTTGHSAMVNWTGPGPNGDTLVKLTESNFHGDEKVTNTRTISMDDPSVLGLFRGTLKPQAQAGSGVSKPTQSSTENVQIDQSTGLKITTPSPFIAGIMSPAEMASAQQKEQSARVSAQGIIDGTLSLKDISDALRPRAVQIAKANGFTQPGDIKVEQPSLQEFMQNLEKASVKDPNSLKFDPKQAEAIYNKTIAAVPSYLDAADNVSTKLTDKKSPIFVAQVRQALADGNYAVAQDKLKKVALDTADSTTSQQVRGRENGLNALDNIQQSLAEYTAKGGKTDLFSGNTEEIKKKIGEVGNIDLRKIATQIQAAIIDYRHAVSGAGFTASEAQQYNDMFPQITNTAALNRANIDALRDVFNGANETFYRQQLGNQNYDAIFGSK